MRLGPWWPRPDGTPTRRAGSDGAPARRSDADPRIWARRMAVLRQQGRRRLILLGSLAAATLLILGVWWVLHSPIFAARSLTVVGATHESAARVEVAAGLAGHPPLLDVNTGAAAAKVEQLPWVRQATVEVHWPDGVRIHVAEWQPSLVVATVDGQWAELTASGRVLQVVPTRPVGLVQLIGPASAGTAGSTLGGGDQVGLQVAATLPASFRAQVTTVHVEPGAWVQLAMTTPILVDIGTTSQLAAKYEDVSALLAGATLHNGDTIDVSVPDAPTVTGA